MHLNAARDKREGNRKREMVLLLAFVLIRESGIARQKGRERENENGL